MPAYQIIGSIPAVYPGDSVVCINAERPAAGTAHQQVALSQNPNGDAIKVSVEVLFTGVPGAFEINLETSDTDVDANYVPQAAVLNGVDAANAARAEFPNIVAKFARLRTKTQSVNVVNCTARIGR